jgi:hypothetical protein
MTQQPDPRVQHTDVTAADLDADIEVPPGAVPATSDPDAFTDDGLGLGDGPDVLTPDDSGN